MKTDSNTPNSPAGAGSSPASCCASSGSPAWDIFMASELEKIRRTGVLPDYVIAAPITPPKCGDDGWVGHEWKMRGFYSDECIHCGTVAVEGHNGIKKNSEHCDKRAAKLSLHNAPAVATAPKDSAT